MGTSVIPPGFELEPQGIPPGFELEPPAAKPVPQILAEEPPHAPTIIPSKRIPASDVMPPVDDRSDARRFLETPLVSPRDVDENLPFLVGPFGVHKGILKSAAGMTSPENAAIMAGTAGLGAAAGATSGAANAALRTGSAGLSAYFGTQAGKQLMERAPEIKQAVHAGDWQKVAELGGSGLMDAAMVGGSALHIGLETGASLHGTPNVIAEHLQNLNDKLDAMKEGTAAKAIDGARQAAAIPPGFELESPTAAPPTAAQPTVPESPDTLQVQLQQLKQSQRNVVMFPKGTPVPELPHGTPVHTDAFGNTYAYDPESIHPAAIDAAAASNTLPQILGDASAGMGAPDKTAVQGDPLTVVSRTMDGTTVQATLTDEANLDATIAATKKVTPPGGTVAVEPAENEIAAREAEQPPAEPPQTPPTPETAAAPPLKPAAAPQDSGAAREGEGIPSAPETPAPTPPIAEATAPEPSLVQRFLEEETGTSTLGALLREDVNQTRALVEQRRAALAEMEKAKTDPQSKDYGQKVIEWFTGERDLWSARVNQLIDSLRKMVPDAVDQEALSLMRDFKNRPGELQQWLDGTHPGIAGAADPALAAQRIQQLRPAIERALAPTAHMQQADALLTQLADISLQEGKRHGFLDSSISPDEYVTHLLHPKDAPEYAPTLTERAVSKMGGKMGRRFSFAKERYYDTLLDAVANNVKPKTLNAFDAFTIHADKFATARATNMLVEQLKDSGVGKWAMSKGEAPGGQPQTNFAGAPGVPSDWVEIAPHAHPFQNAGAYIDAATGEPRGFRQSLYVPKYVEEALRPITDPDYMSKVRGFTAMRAFQAYTKAVQLGLSLFHATTENYMAAANMGPKGWWKGITADRDSAAFHEQERRYIAAGLTTSIQGKTIEAYKSLQPGSIPTWGDIVGSVTGIRHMQKVASGITEFTFGRLQRQFKVTDMALHEAAWIAKNPHATPAEQTAALGSMAKEVNAVYGGLNWERLGLNRMTTNVARALMLAPDWTFSNYFNLKYTLGPEASLMHPIKTLKGLPAEGFRGRTPETQMARAFWTRQIVGGMVATQMLSLAVSGHLSKRPTQAYYGKDKDGLDIYQNVFFKGAPGDVSNLITNISDYGAVEGLAKSAAGKAAPIPRTAIQLMTNKDYLGQDIVKRGLNPVAGTVRGAAYAAKGLSPVPLSFMNAYDMVFGKNASRYTPPEVLSTLFAGTPPSHVAPEGMKMTKRGLRVQRQRPKAPIWDQIRTGKPDLPAPGPVR